MSTPGNGSQPRASASEIRAWRATASVLLRQIRVGSLTIVEGKRRRVFGTGAPAAVIDVHDGGFWRMLMRGSRGLAESYAQGLWDSPDLVAVIRLAARNAVLIDRVRSITAPLWSPRQRVRALLTRSTRQRSQRDIEAHYDLGNELFERMLDSTMMYSCALFEREGMTLEEASIAKLERVCEQLELGPDDQVLEIGTGWGGFAVHAAATRGCHVTTTTISTEQHEYASQRVREAGLGDKVTVVMRDYRDLTGSFDKLVSIEMIEAVGWQHIGTFFEQCSRLLTPHGAMLLQAITIDDRAYEVEKASKSFIKEYIFPGRLPALDGGHHAATSPGAPTCRRSDWRTSPPATSRRCGGGATTSSPARDELASSSATTSASSGCGRCTSPTARAASPSGGSATCSCCWPSRDGRSTRAAPEPAAPRLSRYRLNAARGLPTGPRSDVSFLTHRSVRLTNVASAPTRRAFFSSVRRASRPGASERSSSHMEHLNLDAIDTDGAIREAAEEVSGDTRLSFLRKGAVAGGAALSGGAILSALIPVPRWPSRTPVRPPSQASGRATSAS